MDLYMLTRFSPSVKIFNATNSENLEEILGFSNGGDIYGDTEVIQQPENIDKILKLGYEGILQKQANPDHYGNLVPNRANQTIYDKYEDKGRKKRRYKSSTYKQPSSNYTQFDGDLVLGIYPKFLIPFKKISFGEALDHLDNKSLGELKRT